MESKILNIFLKPVSGDYKSDVFCQVEEESAKPLQEKNEALELS